MALHQVLDVVKTINSSPNVRRALFKTRVYAFITNNPHCKSEQVNSKWTQYWKIIARDLNPYSISPANYDWQTLFNVNINTYRVQTGFQFKF